MGIRNMVDSLTGRCRRAGFPEFAWWIPFVMDGFAFVAGAVAVAQRADQSALLPASLLMAVAFVPWCLDIGGVRLPWPVFMAITVLATGTMMVRYPVDYDFALLVWVMLVGHFGATESIARGLVATLVAGVTLKILGSLDLIEGSAFWLAALVVGWDVGFIMQYQQRRLEEQERAHRDREAAAVLEERQRIAREVHDVVAHSLSVTMLHLTAARRSLEEDRGEGVDEAIEALRDAEHVGREAMTDIRTTVGLLGQDAGVTNAAPDLRDLPALVDDFRTAGLDVTLDVRGDLASVPANTGLGVYRIAQESLANVAKHQPGAQASVSLDCDLDRQHLIVSNTLIEGTTRQAGGSGLKGMLERAELLGGSLHAGLQGDSWIVEATIPAQGTEPEPGCPFGLRGQATAESA